MSAIYVYDNRTQYQEPIVVVYNDAHVRPAVLAILGCYPDYVVESRVRLHPYDKDPYTSMGSNKSPYKKRK